MPSPKGGRGRGIDVADMSPLQQRLLNTYMDALAEQEAREESKEEEEERQSRAEAEERSSAARAAAERAEHGPMASMSPRAKASFEEPPGASQSRQRSDLYAKKMSELLLKGWKMLGENCPETGSVPLMQHPTDGRKFSIATGRYTDELPSDVTDSAVPPPSAPSPSPSPSAPTGSSPRPSAAKLLGREPSPPRKRQDDEWSETMGQLMLKGWKMLNEQCPITGVVPLMEHPSNGRKFSVAAKKFMDEVEERGGGTAASGACVATLPSTSSTTPAAPAQPAQKDDDDDDDYDDEAAAAIQAQLMAPPKKKAGAAPPAAAASKPLTPLIVDRQPTPPAPPPTRAASRTPSGGCGAYSPSAQGLAALDDAAAAIASQLAWSASQLTSTPPPAPKSLLDAIGQLAESLQAVESARRVLLE